MNLFLLLLEAAANSAGLWSHNVAHRTQSQLPPGQASQLIALPPPPASCSSFHLATVCLKALTKAQTVGQELHSMVISVSLAGGGKDDATGSLGKEEQSKASATIADSRAATLALLLLLLPAQL